MTTTLGLWSGSFTAPADAQLTCPLRRGEFAVLRTRSPTAYQAAGLSHDTKFEMGQAVDLPYNAEWFSVPPAAPHGQNPKLGTLHPALVRAAWHRA